MANIVKLFPQLPRLNSNDEDLVARGSYAVQFWNLIYDDNGNIASRPGHIKWFDMMTEAPVYGYWWDSQGLLALVSRYTLRLVNRFGIETAYPVSTISGASPVVFADDGPRLFFASNGRIHQFMAGGSSVTVLSDPVAPTSVSALLTFDGYLLANEVGTNRVWFASPVDPEPHPGQPYKWSAPDGGFFSAETAVDSVQSLYSMARQIVVIGSRTVEFWANDGASPFSRSGAVITNQGAPSPRSSALAVDSIYMLTQRRKVVRIDNGSFSDVTGGIAQELAELKSVTDVETSYVQTGTDAFVMFNFPSDGLSFVYDVAREAWMKWGVWNPASSMFEANVCSSYVHAPMWNRWLGMTRDGRVMEMTQERAEDNGVPIRSVLRLGFTDAGTPLRKFVIRDILQVRRGRGTYDEGNPANTDYPCFLTLRYRDDADMTWHARQLHLGESGEYYQKVVCHRMGSYNQRQYEIEYSDRTPFTLRDFYTEIDLAVI